MNNIFYYAIGIFQGLIYSAAIPINVFFAESIGASYIEIAVLTAALSVVPLLTAMHIGKFIDRYGEKLPLVIGLSGMSISLMIPVFFPVIFGLLLTHLLLGPSLTLSIIALQNGVASVEEERRERSIANFSIFASTGVFLGPLLGGYFIEFFGYRATYLIFSCIMILPIFLSKFIKSCERPPDNRGTKAKESQIKVFCGLLKTPKMIKIIFVSMVTLAAIDLFNVYLPLLGSANGLSPSQVGWLIAIQGISFFGVRIIMPGIINRYGHSYTLFGFILVSAFAYGGFPFFDRFQSFAFLALIVGFGFGISPPVTTLMAYNNAPKGRTAEVLGLRMASNRLAQLVMPPLVTSISFVGGLTSIFVVIAALMIVAAFVAVGIRSEEGKYDKDPC